MLSWLCAKRSHPPKAETSSGRSHTIFLEQREQKYCCELTPQHNGFNEECYATYGCDTLLHSHRHTTLCILGSCKKPSSCSMFVRNPNTDRATKRALTILIYSACLTVNYPRFHLIHTYACIAEAVVAPWSPPRYFRRTGTRTCTMMAVLSSVTAIILLFLDFALQ